MKTGAVQVCAKRGVVVIIRMVSSLKGCVFREKWVKKTDIGYAFFETDRLDMGKTFIFRGVIILSLYKTFTKRRIAESFHRVRKSVPYCEEQFCTTA